jgi:hypothetical protein
MNKREAIAKPKCHANAVKALGATSLYLFGVFPTPHQSSAAASWAA